MYQNVLTAKKAEFNQVVPLQAERKLKRKLQEDCNKSINGERVQGIRSKLSSQMMQANAKFSSYHLAQQKVQKLKRRRKICETDDYFDNLRQVFPEIIKKQQEDIDRMQHICMLDSAQRNNDDISSDECLENATVFQFLAYRQRMRHMSSMWRKCYIKAKAAGQVLTFVRDIQEIERNPLVKKVRVIVRFVMRF